MWPLVCEIWPRSLGQAIRVSNAILSVLTRHYKGKYKVNVIWDHPGSPSPTNRFFSYNATERDTDMRTVYYIWIVILYMDWLASTRKKNTILAKNALSWTAKKLFTENCVPEKVNVLVITDLECQLLIWRGQIARWCTRNIKNTMIFVAKLYYTQEGNGAGGLPPPPHPCAAEDGVWTCAGEGLCIPR